MSPSDAVIEAIRTIVMLIVGALMIYIIYDSGILDPFIRMVIQ